MTAHVDETIPPSPFFHDATGVVRFWVLNNGAFVGATVAQESLRYHFRAGTSGADALAAYTAHRVQLDDAVRRRIAKGSVEPVMLRDADVAPPTRP